MVCTIRIEDVFYGLITLLLIELLYPSTENKIGVIGLFYFFPFINIDLTYLTDGIELMSCDKQRSPKTYTHTKIQLGLRLIENLEKYEFTKNYKFYSLSKRKRPDSFFEMNRR